MCNSEVPGREIRARQRRKTFYEGFFKIELTINLNLFWEINTTLFSWNILNTKTHYISAFKNGRFMKHACTYPEVKVLLFSQITDFTDGDEVQI